MSDPRTPEDARYKPIPGDKKTLTWSLSDIWTYIVLGVNEDYSILRLHQPTFMAKRWNTPIRRFIGAKHGLRSQIGHPQMKQNIADGNFEQALEPCDWTSANDDEVGSLYRQMRKIWDIERNPKLATQLHTIANPHLQTNPYKCDTLTIVD